MSKKVPIIGDIVTSKALEKIKQRAVTRTEHLSKLSPALNPKGNLRKPLPLQQREAQSSKRESSNLPSSKKPVSFKFQEDDILKELMKDKP